MSKSRTMETGYQREWVCPNCGHKEKRHHSARKRPFCDPCDGQFAVLIEMEPYKNGHKVSFAENGTLSVRWSE